MTIKDAAAERFKALCAELGISATELTRAAGCTPSTVYSMLDRARREVKLSTIKALVDGVAYYKKGFTVPDFLTTSCSENWMMSSYLYIKQVHSQRLWTCFITGRGLE